MIVFAPALTKIWTSPFLIASLFISSHLVSPCLCTYHRLCSLLLGLKFVRYQLAHELLIKCLGDCLRSLAHKQDYARVERFLFLLINCSQFLLGARINIYIFPPSWVSSSAFFSQEILRTFRSMEINSKLCQSMEINTNKNVWI